MSSYLVQYVLRVLSGCLSLVVYYINGICVIKTLNTFITYTVFPTTGMLYSFYLYFHYCTKRCM